MAKFSLPFFSVFLASLNRKVSLHPSRRLSASCLDCLCVCGFSSSRVQKLKLGEIWVQCAYINQRTKRINYFGLSCMHKLLLIKKCHCKICIFVVCYFNLNFYRDMAFVVQCTWTIVKNVILRGLVGRAISVADLTLSFQERAFDVLIYPTCSSRFSCINECHNLQGIDSLRKKHWGNLGLIGNSWKYSALS